MVIDIIAVVCFLIVAAYLLLEYLAKERMDVRHFTVFGLKPFERLLAWVDDSRRLERIAYSILFFDLGLTFLTSAGRLIIG